ncbi:MAG: pseudouridine-5'-phosphate glycosidase [Propionibacterium sp.]|nr:pseudouridine-5'-phosphate glycosidase [Propionibacterium sp.]
MNEPIRVSEEVSDAVAAGRPVLALESTIFTHGLPRPRNVEVAARGERVARELGVVPATIGVVDGVGVVGLSGGEIERLAHDDDVAKASVRDLPVCAALGRNAGTTIAATTLLARRAGISVFSTGGLGGVHHHASTTFDESADLVTLAHEAIVLVSSGAKAILDIPATLERFETLSVPVIGYRTLDYPGFYVRSSGHRLTSRIETPGQAAEIFRASQALGLPASVLIANPIPEADSLDPHDLDAVIEEAWAAAEADRISGQATTPYLLDYIRRATGDRSLEANVALYLNNVRLGARIATALASA